ncbi:hypothetical protein OPIT5_12145 [Opitutaceae bacterium TAV5]|nr:hypothetical protein OPIT5_12145 [Opitutaceae bacterium TAV5]
MDDQTGLRSRMQPEPMDIMSVGMGQRTLNIMEKVE